ncbi:hypothetical protein K432DRAFT_146608 [Lepidopterella palustris CBS 459.81]|uniref:Uncharacterized protein n=1 Tax=Lepidopterella palustris CBS 459.81 TaxID=1314670 RepID=A0A8E2E311_9PEZI|nr:hypothetical protein K432DRAFT_146608 [Lepidopterella palustris CBS 459.81]
MELQTDHLTHLPHSSLRKLESAAMTTSQNLYCTLHTARWVGRRCWVNILIGVCVCGLAALEAVETWSGGRIGEVREVGGYCILSRDGFAFGLCFGDQVVSWQLGINIYVP